MDRSGKLKRNISFLAPGRMPIGVSPEKWLAAGPWCFAGQESRFPDWEERFLFAPEPLATGNLLPDAAAAAQTLALLAIPEVAATLSDHPDHHSLLYWQTLLLPWSLAVSRQIVERSMRVDALVGTFGNSSLRVAQPPKTNFYFRDESDFVLSGCLDPDWNHWLITQLLQERMPQGWQWLPFEKADATREDLTAPRFFSGQKFSLRKKIAGLVRRLIFKLAFPPLKGMSLWQALRFSLTLRNYRSRSSGRQDLLKEYCKPEILAKFHMPARWLEIMLACIPESLKNLHHEKRAKKTSIPRLRIASVRAHEDACYRQELALWMENGNHLAYVQHGCNYGQVKVACDAPLLEYSQDLFFSWGWDKYSAAKGKFVPMPYPQLAKIAHAWKGRESNSLIFVGSEMATTAYRLDSHPTPLQITAYRKGKSEFFGKLPKEILGKSYYRPYFRLPGCLADEEWLLPKFPELKLCEGALMPQILACRLLVIDHPGTTMLEAFAAGVPMVAYWDRRYWPLGKECDSLLDSLEESGVWQSNPQKAAEMAAKIWESPVAWLNSAKVSKAYESWRKYQAKLPEGNLEKAWIEMLENL